MVQEAGTNVKNTILTTTFTAVVGLATVTVLGAQTTTSQQQPTPSAPAASAEKTITVVGCLRPDPSSNSAAAASTAGATAGATGTSGTAGTTGTTATGTTGTTAGAAATPTPTAPANAAAAADQKFILEDAGIPAADAGTTSTAGAAAQTTQPAQSGQKETYRLVANGSALSPHVGKKLELTGVLEANSSTATDSTSGAAAGRPMLRVQSGRVIAASCDQK
jgi:hypothetical protein